MFFPTALSEVILIKPVLFEDERGFFYESYKYSVFKANGINEIFLQDNHSLSKFAVLRGLHYQIKPYAQAKLVRCISGSVFDVAVDLRKDSPTFAQWVGYELSEVNKHMLYIPDGFAHGFLTLSTKAELNYKTTNEYGMQYDRGIRFDDPLINITWPQLKSEYILSQKDSNLPLLEAVTFS